MALLRVCLPTLLSAGSRRLPGVRVSSKLTDAHGRVRIPRGSSRESSDMEVLFNPLLWSKEIPIAKSRFKGLRNKFLMGDATKSCCKGKCMKEWKKFGADILQFTKYDYWYIFKWRFEGTLEVYFSQFLTKRLNQQHIASGFSIIAVIIINSLLQCNVVVPM